MTEPQALLTLGYTDLAPHGPGEPRLTRASNPLLCLDPLCFYQGYPRSVSTPTTSSQNARGLIWRSSIRELAQAFGQNQISEKMRGGKGELEPAQAIMPH